MIWICCNFEHIKDIYKMPLSEILIERIHHLFHPREKLHRDEHILCAIPRLIQIQEGVLTDLGAILHQFAAPLHRLS